MARGSSSPDASVTLRRGEPADAGAVAEIRRLGWRDAHVGLVPERLLEAGTDASFHGRAAARFGEMTVAVVGCEVAGFVLVVDDEAAANGRSQASLAVVAANARARRFYERAGWRDGGPFEHEAASDIGPIPVSATATRSTRGGAK